MRLEMAGVRGAAGALIKGVAMDPRVVPGTRVRHPTEPGWGVGHVQSVIGDRITVNFEGQGKVVINGGVINLEVIETRA